LVEHHNGIVGVRGSNPLGSTSQSKIKEFRASREKFKWRIKNSLALPIYVMTSDVYSEAQLR
jgi:hypothetical protein